MCTPIEFLLVEDNPGDVRLTQEFFKEYKLTNSVSIVIDAYHTLSYLRRQGVYADVSRPDIILCSLPLYQDEQGGVWDDIRRDAYLQDIPIVLLTGFEGEEAAIADLSSISCCIAKPLDFGDISMILSHLSDLGVVVTSPRGRTTQGKKAIPA